jgi:hypothetical protein
MREESTEAAQEGPAEAPGREIEPERGAGYALGYVPRLVVGALEDLRSIARSVSVLPEVGQALVTIQRRVDSLDQEVRRMRHAVEAIDTDVLAMQESLTDELSQTREGVARVERELGSAVHPLRRVAGRLSRRPGPGS